MIGIVWPVVAGMYVTVRYLDWDAASIVTYLFWEFSELQRAGAIR
jgi:hypothetical protein